MFLLCVVQKCTTFFLFTFNPYGIILINELRRFFYSRLVPLGILKKTIVPQAQHIGRNEKYEKIRPGWTVYW
jgi:hypothetical protein